MTLQQKIDPRVFSQSEKKKLFREQKLDPRCFTKEES
jgi:hypothetical protein